MNKENDPLDGFSPAISKHFYLKGTSLTIRRIWDSADDFDTIHPSEFLTQINGRCVLERGDGVRIIGTQAVVREFELQIRSDERVADEWKLERQAAVSLRPQSFGDEARNRIFGHAFDAVLKQGDERAPTANLFYFRANHEVGREETWSCTVKVPASVFAALETEMLAGRVEKVQVGITWWMTLLAYKYANAADSNVWGILPNDAGFLGERLIGRLSSLSWWPTLGPIQPPQPSAAAAEPDKRKRGWP